MTVKTMKPSDMPPGNWVDLEDVEDVNLIRRVWVNNRNVVDIEPGSFFDGELIEGPGSWRNRRKRNLRYYASTIPAEAVQFTRTDGTDISLDLADVVAVEV